MRHSLSFFLISAAISLVGCNGGHHHADSNSTPASVNTDTPPAATISGTAFHGPVSGGKVTAYELDATAQNGKSIGETVTNSDGTFTLPISEIPAAGLRLVVSGGSYLSEANTLATITDSSLSAVIPSIDSNGLKDIVISPLTSFVDSRLAVLIVSEGGKSISEVNSDADSNIKKIYGIRSENASLTGLTPDFTAASGANAQLAFILGALEELAIKQGKTPIQIISALEQDIADGQFDGKAADGSSIKYDDAQQAPSTLGNGQFLSALSSYLDPNNKSTLTSSNGVIPDSSAVSEIRASIITASSKSAGLDVSSSGAITSLTLAGSDGKTKQIVYFAAKTKGLRAIDFTNPSAPTEIDLSALNSLLLTSASKIFNSIDGVISVPAVSTNPQLLLYSFNLGTVVLVDAVTNSITDSLDTKIKSTVRFSGAAPSIFGGIPDSAAAMPTVWLTTADGYLPITISGSKLAAGVPVPSVNKAGYPENVGASVTDRLIFAPGYNSEYYAAQVPALSVLNLDTRKLYTLDSGIYTSAINMIEPDAGAVDTSFKVGITVEEVSNTIAAVDLRGLLDGSQYALNETTHTFAPTKTDQQIKKIKLDSGKGGYVSGVSFSGVNIDSGSHLAFFIEEFGPYNLGVARIDDPANPVDPVNGWSGILDYRYATSAKFNPSFSSGRDPHTQATITNFVNGKSYGITSKNDGAGAATGAVIVDLSAFLAAPAEDASHQLKDNPFTSDSVIIKQVDFK